MSENISDHKNVSRSLKSSSRLYQVVMTTPKTSLGKLTLTVFEMQHLTEIEKTGPEEEISCSN